jgi:hypothetical protein
VRGKVLDESIIREFLAVPLAIAARKKFFLPVIFSVVFVWRIDIVDIVRDYLIHLRGG